MSVESEHFPGGAMQLQYGFLGAFLAFVSPFGPIFCVRGPCCRWPDPGSCCSCGGGVPLEFDRDLAL